MYNGLLNRVIDVIHQAVDPQPTIQERWDIEALKLFDPARYIYEMDRRAQKQERARSLILVATGLAVVGETYHLARRSGILKKIGNKLF